MPGPLCKHWSRRVPVWILVMSVLVAPLADVAVFGIHDHVSVSAGEQGSLTATGADPAPSHHCELGMSPCAVLDVNELSIPAAVVLLSGAPPPLLASHTPFVPFAPPRA